VQLTVGRARKDTWFDSLWTVDCTQTLRLWTAHRHSDCGLHTDTQTVDCTQTLRLWTVDCTQTLKLWTVDCTQTLKLWTVDCTQTLRQAGILLEMLYYRLLSSYGDQYRLEGGSQCK